MNEAKMLMDGISLKYRKKCEKLAYHKFEKFFRTLYEV